MCIHIDFSNLEIRQKQNSNKFFLGEHDSIL